MALVITDECINCGACVTECPNNAIYEGAQEWTIADGTSVTEPYRMKSGEEIDPFEQQAALHDDLFFIVPDKCTECTGFHDEPQCASVCPVDCCVPDPERVESEDELLERKQRLHN